MRTLLLALCLSAAPGLGLAQSTAPKAKPAQVARPAAVAKEAAKATPAATVSLLKSGILLDLPKGWTSEGGSGPDESYTLLSPDQVTTLMLFAVPAQDIEGALADLETTLSGVVKGAKLDEPAKGEVGGMPALMADGTATMDGHDVELGLLMVLNEKSQRVVFVVGFSLAGQAAYAQDVAAILHSVRRRP